MSDTVFNRIEALLRAHEVTPQVTHHEPVFTSEEAAAIRGVELCSGAKALVCKCDGQMVMFVVPADRRLDSKAVRREAGWRKIRFASQDEVLEITGLRPGSIPPFGSLFKLPTCCDPALGENERINFNAGDHAISVSITYADYVRAENPRMMACSKLPE
jgi:Ala-tRNA(Pro) deacylase